MIRKKLKILNILAVSVFTLTACVNGKRNAFNEQIKQSLSNYDYKTAISTVNNEKYISGDNSILLKKMEQGAVYYRSKNYYQALQYLDEAEKISDELYTISLSKKAVGAINSNFDKYYGTGYEKSLIYFYKSMANYNLYVLGKYESYEKNEDGNKKIIEEKILNDDERLEHLRKARSNIMKWDSILKAQQNEGIKDYNLELLEKLWGAFIFEENGSFTDIQRALNMYKSADKILKQKPELDSIEPNKKISDFINNKIKQLTNNEKNNLVIMLNDGYIQTKKVEEKSVPFDLALLAVISQNNDFYSFLRDAFRLSVDIDVVEAATKNDTEKPITGATIKIKLPYLDKPLINNIFIAEIYDKDGKNKLNEFGINLLESIDRAEFDLFEKNKLKTYSAIIAKTSLAHATALITAYNIYHSTDNSLTRTSAVFSYVAAAKLINKSDVLDLRQWATIPSNIRTGSIKLKEGDYILKIKSINVNDNTQTKYIYDNIITINNNKTTFININ